MNIAIAKSVLENILTNLQPFLEKKDASQITSHVFINALSDNVIIRATDYEIGLEAKTDNAQVHMDGIATVNGKKILDIVRRLSDTDIILTTENDQLHLKQGSSSFKLPMFNAEEFPTFPKLEGNPKIGINSQSLIQSIKKIIPAIDTNNPKFELNGALIDIVEYAVNFVATDTRRLAIVKYENQSIDKLSLIIPKKAIIEIQKLFHDDIEMYYNDVNLMIKSSNNTFFTKLINGKYPDYERIIPKETKHNLSLPKDKIIEAIRLVTSISNDVKITIAPEKMAFESLSEENSEAKTEFDIQTGIPENYVMAINSKYMLDFLAQTETNEFMMNLNEPNLPFVLKSESFTTIIMPIVM